MRGIGLNVGLSNMLSEILEPIAGEMRGRVERGSTENTLYDVDRYNELVIEKGVNQMMGSIVDEILTQVTGNRQAETVEESEKVEHVRDNGRGFQGSEGSEVLIGMDAVALYPSISMEVAMEECEKAAMNSEIEVRNINYMEATRFLALCLDKDQIKTEGLRGLLPVRRPSKKGGKTRELKLTTANSLGPSVNDQKQWKWSKVNLSTKDKKKIFGMVTACLVQIFCETQVYTWRGLLYRQLKGLPIGPRATSAIARIVMNSLDRMVGEFLDKIEIETDIHVRYIDGIRFLLRMILPGTVLENGKLAHDEVVEARDRESACPEVVSTARLLRDLLNKMIPGIVFTTETKQQDFPEALSILRETSQQG